jgi:hypothetical protein
MKSITLLAALALGAALTVVARDWNEEATATPVIAAQQTIPGPFTPKPTTKDPLVRLGEGASCTGC